VCATVPARHNPPQSSVARMARLSATICASLNTASLAQSCIAAQAAAGSRGQRAGAAIAPPHLT